MTMSLPLVTENRFEEAIRIIEDVSNSGSYDDSKISQFLNYLRNTWLPMASIVSVSDCPIRTNNDVESFHSTVIKKMGGRHPNIWVFLGKFPKILLADIFICIDTHSK